MKRLPGGLDPSCPQQLPILASFPSPSHFLSPLQVLPEIIFQINYPHSDLCLSVCFWGRPARESYTTVCATWNWVPGGEMTFYVPQKQSLCSDLIPSCRAPYFLRTWGRNTHRAASSLLCPPLDWVLGQGDWDLAQVWPQEDAQNWLLEWMRLWLCPGGSGWGLGYPPKDLAGMEGMLLPAAPVKICDSREQWFLEYCCHSPLRLQWRGLPARRKPSSLVTRWTWGLPVQPHPRARASSVWTQVRRMWGAWWERELGLREGAAAVGVEPGEG